MKRKLEKEIKVTNKMKETILTKEASKSSKMKELFELGLTIKEISTLLDVRYNFVYNVISNYVIVNKIELVETKKESKKDKIIEMYLDNKTNKEISIELGTNYNYVYNTIKQYKQQNDVEKKTS